MNVLELKNNIKQAVINMFKINMGLKPGEKVLVVTDYPEKDHWSTYDVSLLEDIVNRSLLARVVYDIAYEEFKDNEVKFLTYPLTGRHGAEPPSCVGDEMAKYNVVIAITSFSLSHTNAREKATQAGARIASMPGFTVDMFLPEGPMSVDYTWVSSFSKKIAEYLKGAKHIRVITESGTDIEFSVEGREWGIDDGIYDKPGAWGNLPAGEVYIAPVEGTAYGRIVVEKGWYPRLEEDMVLHVRDGLVVEVEGGGNIGDYFREVLGLKPRIDDELHRARRNIAEFGIGTNPKAKRPDNVLEAEKIFGTIHIAIGDNIHLGGRVEADLHEDFIIPKPTVYVDGKLFMDKGKHVIT